MCTCTLYVSCGNQSIIFLSWGGGWEHRTSWLKKNNQLSMFAASQVLQSVWGWSVGSAEGMCWVLHDDLVRLLFGDTTALSCQPVCGPVGGPVALGAHVSLPAAGPLHLNICRPHAHWLVCGWGWLCCPAWDWVSSYQMLCRLQPVSCVNMSDSNLCSYVFFFVCGKALTCKLDSTRFCQRYLCVCVFRYFFFIS